MLILNKFCHDPAHCMPQHQNSRTVQISVSDYPLFPTKRLFVFADRYLNKYPENLHFLRYPYQKQRIFSDIANHDTDCAEIAVRFSMLSV